MSQSRVQQLRQENAHLKQKIALFQGHQNSGSLKGEIEKFVQESKKNLNQMNRKIVEQNSKQNQILHALTANYENVLKKQIELLTENKTLSQQKQSQDRVFNENIEKLTQEYEGQIKEFENKVKANVKKLQDLSGGNIINRLLRNSRFKQAMEQRGCSLQSLEKQSQLEEISIEVEEKQKQIQEAEGKSAKLDEELSKMHELIDTMKSLLENMMKEKQNILKQNLVLKEKLKQSEELIGRLLGAEAGEGVAEEEGEEDEEEGEEEEVEKEEEEEGEDDDQGQEQGDDKLQKKVFVSRSKARPVKKLEQTINRV